MRLVQFSDAGPPVPGLVSGDEVVPLRVAPGLSVDETIVSIAMGERDPDPTPGAGAIPLDEVVLRTPLRRPPSIRDFMLFEGHVANSLKHWDRPVPPRWYDAPSFYFTATQTLVASGGDVVAARDDVELDYELELGVVIGRDLVDADPDEAAEAIAGFTLLNDFSLRDRQSRERPLGLGPSKSKDFATALGPVLVTPDEIPGTARRPELVLEAWVNGERWSRGETATMHFDLGEAIAHASAGSRVVAGDVIGSGTVTTGCVMELLSLGDERARWLRPGDVVELRSPHIGTLRTSIVAHPLSTPTRG